MINDFKFGEFTVKVDCDVLQADGGTRTAAITGACVAVTDAFDWLVRTGRATSSPVQRRIAAVSVGVIDGEPRLDLDYEEDVRAAVDRHVGMSSEGRFVQVQGTGEQGVISAHGIVDEPLVGLKYIGFPAGLVKGELQAEFVQLHSGPHPKTRALLSKNMWYRLREALTLLCPNDANYLSFDIS